MKFVAAGFTEPGPRSLNEDAFGIWHMPDGRLAVAVADGLGGMGAGDKASHLAIETFGNLWTQNQLGLVRPVEAAQTIHQIIRNQQSLSPENTSMATTLSAGILEEGLLTGIHAGDSRVAIARSKGIRRLTTDHTEAARLVARGKLTKDELADYPRKHILESALGIHSAPQIDTFHFELKLGDKLFFTTDGFHNKILLRELRDLAAQSAEPQELVDKAGRLMSVRKPEDNYSLIVVYVMYDSWGDKR